MRPFLTAGLAKSVRHIFEPAVVAHTFTWTPHTFVDRTMYGYQPAVPGTPVPMQFGRYLSKTQLQNVRGGRTVATEPPITDDSLLVPWNHPITVDDEVSDVRDRDGIVLLAGPVRVASIIPGAGLGRATKKRLVLEGKTVDRLG